MNNTVQFPSHLIDPRSKGREWILQYAKAAHSAWNNENPGKIFYNARYEYEVFKQYAHGNQSINKYKPLMGVDEESRETWLNIDWSVVPIIPKFRRIALGRLSKVDYNIVATPIDPIAAEETDDYFARMKAKLMMREEAEKIDPSLLEVPALQLTPEEARDIEELELQRNYTFKHQMSIEAEQAIKLVLEQNQIEKLRDKIREDLFDYGVAGYKEYIDSNGAIKIRTINPRNIIINQCKNKDFSDASYVGEIIEMTLADLKQMAGNEFTEEEYQDIAKNVLGRYGNPREWPSSLSIYNRGYDKFNVRVLDIEFFSVNEMVFEQRIDRRGNKIYARAKYEDRNKRKEKFERVAYKVVYKGRWIIDTNYIFDYGLATNMKRAKSSLMDTKLSYHIFAPEFWDMRAYGMMEQIIPIADAIQLAWYRLQNVIAQSIPKGIMIEMGALEDIPLGKGGSKMKPLHVVDLFKQTGVLVYRKADSQGRMTNYKPIEELENGLGRDAMNYWQLIQNHIQTLRDITGMNEFTDGSTPDPRALTTVAKLAYEGTNNSLYNIVSGEKKLLEALANDIVLRIQDVAEVGGVKGYVRSLGGGTMKFFQMSPKVGLHEFGIFLEDKPTDDQRQMLIAEMTQYKQAGLLEPEDSFIIQNTDNLKVAQQLLAYRVKRKKKEMEQETIRNQQFTAQAQQESALVAEQAKQQTLQVDAQVKAMLIEKEKMLDAELMKLKYQFEIQIEQIRQGGKIETKKEENKGKKSVTKIKMGQPDEEEIGEIYNPPFEMPEERTDVDEMEDEYGTEQQYTELQGEGEEELADEEPIQ